MLTLQEKVQLKQLVRERLFKLINDMKMSEDENMKLVYETIAEACAKVLNKKLVQKEEEPESEIMNFNQAQAFRNIEIPFGVHKGTKIGELDTKYLRNLCSPNDFIKKLKRYIAYLDSIGGAE